MKRPFARIGRAVARCLEEQAVGIAAVTVEIALLLFPMGSVHGAEVAGVRLEPRARVGGVDLVLNGAGLRQRFMTDVYVIGLYVAERTSAAEQAIDAPGPKRIALTFLREVSAQSLVDALYEGIRDHSTEAELARLKAAAKELAAIMLPLQTAHKGDTVALDYLPNAGAQVVVNGRAIGEPVGSRELYRALLRIWLGNHPVDAELKRRLLSAHG